MLACSIDPLMLVHWCERLSQGRNHGSGVVPFPEQLAFLEECLAKICHQDLWHTFLNATVRKMVMPFHFHILHFSAHSKQPMDIEADSSILYRWEILALRGWGWTWPESCCWLFAHSTNTWSIYSMPVTMPSRSLLSSPGTKIQIIWCLI